MPRFPSVAAKLAFWVVVVSLLVQVPLAIYDYRLTRATMEESISKEGRYLVLLTVKRIEAKLQSVEDAARTLAALPFGADPSQELRAFIRANPHIYGAAIAYANKDDAPYVHRAQDGRSLQAMNLAKEDYHYRDWDWYKNPLASGVAAWSEPYIDRGGGEALMATYSVPFSDGDDVGGVVTADLTLKEAAQICSETAVGESGYAFLVSRTGRVIYHPNKEHSPMESLVDVSDAPLAAVVGKMVAGESGHVIGYQCAHTKQAGALAYRPILSSGWSVGIMIPANELIGGVKRWQWIRLLLLMIGMASLVLVTILMARKITRPLARLAESTRHVAKGELDFDLNVPAGRDEVSQLAQSFEGMRTDLKTHIATLTRTTAENQKTASELAIAHELQMSMVPEQGAAKVSFPGVELVATLLPARAVGGDWYDYVRLDDANLVVIIGDVSDKGVAAALFMSRAVALIRAMIRESSSPGVILTEANREFARDNPSCMFATVFCGIMNLQTGVLTYANAGHLSPLLCSAGDVSYVEVERGLPLGLAEETVFPESTIQLRKSDALVLYTDGITEAFNSNEEAFGDERVVELLSQKDERAPAAIETRLLESVRQFAKDAPQSDDITMLTLQYVGGPNDA